MLRQYRRKMFWKNRLTDSATKAGNGCFHCRASPCFWRIGSAPFSFIMKLTQWHRSANCRSRSISGMAKLLSVSLPSRCAIAPTIGRAGGCVAVQADFDPWISQRPDICEARRRTRNLFHHRMAVEPAERCARPIALWVAISVCKIELPAHP